MNTGLYFQVPRGIFGLKKVRMMKGPYLQTRLKDGSRRSECRYLDQVLEVARCMVLSAALCGTSEVTVMRNEVTL